MSKKAGRTSKTCFHACSGGRDRSEGNRGVCASFTWIRWLCDNTVYHDNLEELGLLKMDFLGLRTLTVIQDAERLAGISSGKTIDINKIDYDDKAVLASIGTGKTDGVFQLESAGMKNFMKELKPQNLEDIIAGISLYRPGPMDFIRSISKARITRKALPMTARCWSRSWHRPMDALFTRNRLCRSCVIWQVIHSDEVTSCEEQCPRRRATSCRKNVRTLCMGIRMRAYQAVLPMESMRRRQIRSMMK